MNAINSFANIVCKLVSWQENFSAQLVSQINDVAAEIHPNFNSTDVRRITY